MGNFIKTRVISWWSGGIASAVACYWAINTFKDVRLVFIDTRNEDDDTYRFLIDCEKFYKHDIEIISRDDYQNITDVWDKFEALNHANGAICSSELKREMRERYQNLDTDYAQVFGFDSSERDRHLNMRRNYPEINCLSPLVDLEYSKERCLSEVQSWLIDPPRMYRFGFRNNNCFKTGCVQGGIGYWQKIQREYPDKFEAMAEREHRYTDSKGKAVTCIRILRDGIKQPCFLKKHPNYPYHIGLAKGREPKSLMECNGFCATKDSELETL